jgi:signal transduction histidine kinase/ActR/RegA family two-component response regulator
MANRNAHATAKASRPRPHVVARREQLRRKADRATRGLDPAVDRLLDAATTIASSLVLDGSLRAAADEARRVIGAHAAAATLTVDGTRTSHALSVSDAYETWQEKPDTPSRVAFMALPSRLSLPALLTTSALEALPAWREVQPRNTRSAAKAPVRGLLAVPLVGRSGQATGCLQLTAKRVGEFDEQDQRVLAFLGRVAAIAAENAHVFEDAQEASRLKDEFLTTLSHELRTPLNAIVGWTHLLRSGTLKGEEVTRAIETIDRNAKAQTQLISDVLDVSRIVSGRLRLNVSPIRPSFVIDEAVESLRSAAEARRIKLRTVVDPSAGPVLADPDRLRQIVWNLLSNAIKFTPAGGHVQVQLALEGKDVAITVADDGAGIGPGFLPHVFDRFRQANASSTRSHGGLGLGLALVRHLTELHGGSVNAESPGEGRGATFRVRLPLLTAERREEPARRSPAEPKLAGVRVLVLDDDADLLEVIKAVLEREKAEVHALRSAEEAFEHIKRQETDVLISNLRLPGEDGYALIRRIRELGPERGGGIAAVALTGYVGTEDRQHAFLAGFQAHLAKPVEPHQLVAVVASLAGHARPG